MWDLPGPGLKPVSPALAGGFLTTAPPRKPPNFKYDPRSVEHLPDPGHMCWERRRQKASRDPFVKVTVHHAEGFGIHLMGLVFSTQVQRPHRILWAPLHLWPQLRWDSPGSANWAPLPAIPGSKPFCLGPFAEASRGLSLWSWRGVSVPRGSHQQQGRESVDKHPTSRLWRDTSGMHSAGPSQCPSWMEPQFPTAVTSPKTFLGFHLPYLTLPLRSTC